MEKITYRLTLDTFKGGIQKVLRGVYTGDVLSRRVAISLSAGSVPCKISDEESIVSAVMYVTKPSGVTNYGNCEILDNVVYYDIIQYDVDVEGIVEMQLKVMSADSVLYAPVFALEVQQSKNSDIIAEQSPQFTALEAALARAEEVYRKRLVSIELTDDLVFIAHYGDNSTYESDAIKNALAFVDDAEKARVIAENERVLAEEQRVLAELERVLAEQGRDSNYNNLWASLNEVIEDTEELQRYVESLVEEGFITESRVLELIEEHGGGAVPDNVLVASEESAQTEPAPKVNADLFGGKAPSDFASAEDIEDIIDGTTQVGNAETLDGHGVEYFAPLANLYFSGILDKQCKDVSIGENITAQELFGKETVTFFTNWHDSTNFPRAYGCGVVIPCLDPTDKEILYLLGDRLCAGALKYNDSTWIVTWGDQNATTADLANYLPLIGGGTVEGSGVAPLTVRSWSASVYLNFENITEETVGALGFYDVDTPVFVNSAYNKVYHLLHTGNKPTGSYTGNGSAEQRTINIGGTGSFLLICESQNLGFVSNFGAVVFHVNGQQTKYFTSNELRFTDGILYMATADGSVNYNGANYVYLVP